MPLTKVGLNLTVLENLELPDFNISNTSSRLIEELPAKANEYTGGHFGTVIISALFLYLYYILTDQGVESDFRFSKIRGLGIATGISGIIGSVMLMLDYFTKLYPIVFCIVIFMLSVIWVIKEEN